MENINERKRPERLKAPFEILKDDNYTWMLMDRNYDQNKSYDGGYISYRQFIVHAIWSYLQLALNSGESDKKVGELLDEFKKVCISEKVIKSEELDKSKFLQIIFCIHNINETDDKSYDILILDKTEYKACYPLHIKNIERFSGLKKSLEDVIGKLPKIIPLLKNNNEWTDKLEEELNELYSFPEKKA